MNIAAIIPAGFLNRHGYQYTHRECIASAVAFADRVYLVKSVREDNDTSYLYWKHNNLTVISDERTWFARTPDGSEWFDAYKVMENVNLGAGLAHEVGYDVAVCLMCNNYVPEPGALRAVCEMMLDRGDGWAWLYRSDQLADQMFSTSVRLPFIVNLARIRRFSADSLEIGGELHGMERGNWPEHDAEAIVDVQLEMTVDDLHAKMDFIRCYSDLVPKRKAAFEWDYHRNYYAAKFRQKARAGQVQSATGLRIAAASQPDFVSRKILEAL